MPVISGLDRPVRAGEHGELAGDAGPGRRRSEQPADGRDRAPAGALLLGEPAAVLEDDQPHAATVAAVPSAGPPAGSQLLSAPWRCLTLFFPVVLSTSILLAIISAAFRQLISFVFL